MQTINRRNACCALALSIVCGASPPPLANAADTEVVFATTSPKEALDRTGAAWRQDTGKAVTIVYATLAALARQIESGAPAESFVSADLDWMDYLQAKKLIRPNTRLNLISDSLVLFAPRNSTSRRVHDLTGPRGWAACAQRGLSDADRP